MRKVEYLWAAILLVPALTVFSSTHVWDVGARGLFVASVGSFVVLRLLLGLRWFLIATYVFALFGVLAVSADFLRNVNLLDLVLAGSLDAQETWAAIRPYAGWTAAVAVLLLIPVIHGGKLRASPWSPRVAMSAVCAGALGFGLFHAIVLRSWPVNVVSVMVAKVIGRDDFLASALPYAVINPRLANSSWKAKRIAASADRETYVLIIGETMRADRLSACGNKRPIALQADALTFCDVSSSSSSTYTSVPLLVSRELPGASMRVSSDATFLKAFEEAGFHTEWISVQGRSIAWPDAQAEEYVRNEQTDRDSLLPTFKTALAKDYPKKLIVLHAYGAHFPYCGRYFTSEASFPANCANPMAVPTAETLPEVVNAYDNAVSESLRFVDAVIAEAAKQPGEAFVMFTADHGENLLDDDRGLFEHALNDPTRWDTRVPAIVWASSTWKDTHAERWRTMAGNLKSRVMHADLIPTLLGAAAIAYEEPRTEPVDLGVKTPPHARTRWVMRRLGDKVDGDRL